MSAPSPQTSVQLFRYDHKLTACALGEPSLLLIRNDSEFGLLISRGAHEDSFTARLYLEEVTYLSVYGREWSYADFDSVAVFQQDEVWVAQETDSRRYFPNPSRRPYHLIFISEEELLGMEQARADGLAFPIFEAAQRHFGNLPGFTYRAKSLETPSDYATWRDAVPLSEYVVAGEG
jgi:hypothetical protein